MRVQHLTQKCLRMGLLFAGAVAGGLFALAPWLGQAVYGLDTPGRLLRILSPMVLSLYMDAIVDGMLKGLGEQVSCVRYNTITMAMVSSCSGTPASVRPRSLPSQLCRHASRQLCTEPPPPARRHRPRTGHPLRRPCAALHRWEPPQPRFPSSAPACAHSPGPYPHCLP